MQPVPAADPDAAYAEWYAWAKREISPDPTVCLSAAEAALTALAAGGDRPAAVIAARLSRSGTGAPLLRRIGPRRRAYAAWYDWARREIGGAAPRLHAASRGALVALERGASSREAAAAARSAVGLPAVPAAPAARAVAGPAGGGQGAAEPPAAGPPPSPPERPQRMYAGFWRRLVAGFIDLGVIGLPFVASTLALVAVPPGAPGGLGLGVGFYAFWALMVWGYFAGLESSPLQATLGKAALGIVVTDLAGRRVSFRRATARHFLKVPLALGVISTVIEVVVTVVTRRKRAVHDFWAGTLVVRGAYVPLVAHQAEEQRLRTSAAPATPSAAPQRRVSVSYGASPAPVADAGWGAGPGSRGMRRR